MRKRTFSHIILVILLIIILLVIKTDFISNPIIVKNIDSVFPSSPLTSLFNIYTDKVLKNMSVSVILNGIFFGVLSLIILLMFIDKTIKDSGKKTALIILFFSLSALKSFSYYYNPVIVPESSQVHYISHPAPFIFSSLLFIYLSYLFFKNKISVYWVYFSFVFSMFIYGETIILLPALFFIFLIDCNIKRFDLKNIKRALLSKKFFSVLAFFLFLSLIFLGLIDTLSYIEFGKHIFDRKAAIVGDYLGGGDALIFINLIKVRDYACCDSIFSLEYLTYIFSIFILISFYIVPLSLFLIKKDLKKNAFVAFMTLIIIFYLIFMIFFNPETIAQDAWWMFSPITFFGYTLFVYLSNFYNTRQVFLFSYILIILNIISFLYMLRTVP